MANTVQHGISNLHFYKRNPDGTYQSGHRQRFAQSFNMGNSGNGRFQVYGDNVKAHDEQNSTGKEGDLQVTKFDSWFYENALGHEVDQYGGHGDVDDGAGGEFAMAFQLEGNGGGRRVVLYCCTATEPTLTPQTDNDGKTSADETSNISATKADVPETVGGVTTTKKRCWWDCEKGHPLYDNFFTSLPHAIMSDGEDVSLNSLTIGTLKLTPSFGAANTNYTASTTSASVAVTAVANDSEATIAIKNGSTTVTNGSTASLSAGENTITITVTNGEESRVYTVVVTKS